MEIKTGVSVKRVDFSDPQGGKGACDRKAATIKAHVRRHVNEGHDIQNAKDFKDAMVSSGGLNGVRVVLVDVGDDGKSILPQVKIAGVSYLNNFQYSAQGVTVWKAYEVGQGKLLSQSEIEGTYNSLAALAHKHLNIVFINFRNHSCNYILDGNINCFLSNCGCTVKLQTPNSDPLLFFQLLAEMIPIKFLKL